MSVPRISCILLLCCGLPLTGAALAEETAVYESLDDVEVGRVFLSPQQRERLDQRRGKPEVRATNPGRTAAVSKKWPDAAGYIVSSSGESRVWSNGDFVAAEKVSDVRFPGDVRVRRGNSKTGIDPEVAEDAD